MQGSRTDRFRTPKGKGDTAMPKMKTHKGTKKRMKLTANGKVKHRSANSGHLMSGKSGDRCRNLRRATTLSGGIRKRVQRTLGNA